MTLQIEQARDLDSLASAAAQITKVIALLFRSGSRVELIARLVQQLNARLFERAWQLIAPPDLVANSCLFVMGSEGRGEQLLKTDQDNGLILRDGYEPPADLPAICERFSAALGVFGYPPCPGGIMLSNPSGGAPRKTLLPRCASGWQPGGDNLTHLAIFMDAHAVVGDAALLAQVSDSLHPAGDRQRCCCRALCRRHRCVRGPCGLAQQVVFAGRNATTAAPEKGGSLPLVHGVRSLALAHQVRATSTCCA